MTKRLEQCGFLFLNLGQPPRGDIMKYKAELGGVELSRDVFLDRWNEAIRNDNADIHAFMTTNVIVRDL